MLQEGGTSADETEPEWIHQFVLRDDGVRPVEIRRRRRRGELLAQLDEKRQSTSHASALFVQRTVLAEEPRARTDLDQHAANAARSQFARVDQYDRQISL